MFLSATSLKVAPCWGGVQGGKRVSLLQLTSRADAPGMPLSAHGLCGSRLAGDGGRKIDASLEGLIAGKPAPTGLVSITALRAGACDQPRWRPRK
ncbi:hypothetical protein UCMB321_0872 [Pseudomonas batumici]|uniref:Uncharacterized protein n=1 Tax=Pseudomonas batumici TaxID=226910 RepID=A0A0C2F2X2_9PSED|nr:hypothetical protein UCMB321_0872 [Pseudomonas batumici]